MNPGDWSPAIWQQLGWAHGQEQGHACAAESSSVVGVSTHPAYAPEVMNVYAQAFLEAFVQVYQARIAHAYTEPSDAVVADQDGA